MASPTCLFLLILQLHEQPTCAAGKTKKKGKGEGIIWGDCWDGNKGELHNANRI